MQSSPQLQYLPQSSPQLHWLQQHCSGGVSSASQGQLVRLRDLAKLQQHPGQAFKGVPQQLVLRTDLQWWRHAVSSVLPAAAECAQMQSSWQLLRPLLQQLVHVLTSRQLDRGQVEKICPDTSQT